MNAMTLTLLASAALALAGCAAPQSGAETPATPVAMDNPVELSLLREQAFEVLSEAAISSDPAMRANAIEAMELAPGRLEPYLRRGLADENLGVRFVSAMVAGRVRLRAVQPAVEPLLRDESIRVRAAAVYALRRMGVDVDPSLLAGMLEHRDARVRAQAAFILGELGDRSATPMLRSAAAEAPRTASLSEIEILRLQIAEAMIKLGDDEAIEMIRAALYPSRPEQLEGSALAAQIIGDVGDRRSIDQLIYLIEAQDEDRMPAEVRLAAAASLAQLGERSGGFVADEFREDPFPALRAQSAYVYGETRRAEHLPKVAAMLQDESGLVRVSAAAAVLKILDAPAVATGR